MPATRGHSSCIERPPSISVDDFAKSVFQTSNFYQSTLCHGPDLLCADPVDSRPALLSPMVCGEVHRPGLHWPCATRLSCRHRPYGSRTRNFPRIGSSVWLVNSAELRTRWRRTCTRAWSPLSRVDDGRLRKRNRSGSSLLARGQSHAKLPTAGEQLQAQAQKISAGPDLTTLTVQVYPVGVPSCVSVPGF